MALHKALHHSCPTILVGPCHEHLCPVVSCQAKEKHSEVWLQISNFHVKTAGPNFTRPSIGQHCLCPEICFTCANFSPVSGLLGYSSTGRGIDRVFSAYQSTRRPYRLHTISLLRRTFCAGFRGHGFSSAHLGYLTPRREGECSFRRL